MDIIPSALPVFDYTFQTLPGVRIWTYRGYQCGNRPGSATARSTDPDQIDDWASYKKPDP